MKKFRNTNIEFEDSPFGVGPWVADSPEHVADGLQHLFDEWATDLRDENLAIIETLHITDSELVEIDGMVGRSWKSLGSTDVDIISAGIRNLFIEGLEEVAQ